MRNFIRYGNKTLFCILFFFSFFFCSCGPKETPKLIIGHDFYYWEAPAEATYGDAMKNARFFKKLEDYSATNLKRVLGGGTHYVWIRAEFEIPENFKHRPLGLVIPHMRFAEQVFCNGAFISQYGDFPPNEQSTLFKAHFFSFPVNILNQEGKNTILIRIYAQGSSGISSHAFIQPTQFAYPNFESINFHHTRVYMFFVGILFFTFILFLCFYLNVREFKEFRDFAIINIFTSFFLMPFFATELPMYTDGAIPFLPFMKLTMCIPPYFMVYFATLFAIDYHRKKYTSRYKLLRVGVLAAQVIVTLLAPTYDALTKITPYMLALLGFQGFIGASVVVHEFRKKESRSTSIQFILGFLPLFISAAIDITIRLIDNTREYPYFSIFGWQISIAIFIVLLAVRFANIYKHNERLSNHLSEEVAAATLDLKDANYELSLLNERLEKDRKHSEMDLEMASVVQRNFFPRPNKHFRGWEIAVCYSPAAKVSGDFYDYYNYNDILNGISLFDVSGHGLSASLVTMLSKNIISRVFQTGFRRKESVDRILTKINNMILYEKGDIDNYMTGILCRFDDSNEDGKCNIELGNAGHPYPLKFSLRDNEVYELKGNDGKPHYGAIGMKGITVSFARSNFSMTTGDILVLYTDGITEATNPNQVQFGTSHMKEIIKKNHARPSSEIIGLIIDELEKFTEYKQLDDDITLIIAKRTNEAEFVADEEHFEEAEEEIEELTDAEDTNAENEAEASDNG